MTVATVLGVPLGTWVGVHFGWRATFLMVAGLGGLTWMSIGVFIMAKMVNFEI